MDCEGYRLQDSKYRRGMQIVYLANQRLVQYWVSILLAAYGAALLFSSRTFRPCGSSILSFVLLCAVLNVLSHRWLLRRQNFFTQEPIPRWPCRPLRCDADAMPRQ